MLDKQERFPSEEKRWRKYYGDKNGNTLPLEGGMYEFLCNCNKHRLSNNAFDYYGKKITYKQMFENIDIIANALFALGIRRGDIVTVCGLNTPEFFELVYAINKVGAISNLVGLTSSIRDLHQQIVDAKSRVVFVIELACEKIIEASKGSEIDRIIKIPIEHSMPKVMQFAVRLKTDSSRIKKANTENIISWREFILLGANEHDADWIRIHSDDLALIVYTGGSTGIPKGVMLSNKNLNSYYINLKKANEVGLNCYRETDKFLACAPLFLAFGISSCGHGALCHSMELILAPNPDPQTVVGLILKKKPNHIAAGKPLIDAMVSMALRKGNTDYSYIKSVMYGGEPADEKWERKAENILKHKNLNASILNGYGMTETSGEIMFAFHDKRTRLLTFPDVDVEIVDPEDCTIEYGYNTEGELCFSADTVMMGYYKNDSETSNAIFEKDGKRWLKTHDLAMVTDDGTISITGRIKRIYYKLSSDNVIIRVYPMRIEEVVTLSPDIEKCAVVGVRDEKTAYKTICYLICSPEKKNERTLENVKRLCHDNLPDSHVPDEYIFIDEFPLTRAGKVDYKKLEAINEHLSGVTVDLQKS